MLYRHNHICMGTKSTEPNAVIHMCITAFFCKQQAEVMLYFPLPCMLHQLSAPVI